MEISFPWPASQGEWLAWLAAAATMAIGLAALAAPVAARIARGGARTAEALADWRGATAGFLLGSGLACILFAQPFNYLALGACWLLTAVARLVRLAADGMAPRSDLPRLGVETALGLAPLAYVLGYVG